MHPQHHTREGVSQPRASLGRPLEQPTNYCSVPQRLIADLHDNVLAIGLYAFVGRLYLIAQTPVPLSRADVLRYDPTLKAGAVKRAFDRLVAGGWLVEAVQEGRKKQRYTPTWGRVNGAPLPWQMDQPCLGRPRHIARLPLDRGLLDICMGKLTPHPTRTATITRYVTVPALSLSDVGCYALTLADLPHETPSLRWLGVVRNGRALPLPAEQQLLAIISQRPLTLDDETAGRDTELTVSGTRRLGLAPLPPAAGAASRAQPLFFVPPGLIGSLIGPLIGSLIGSDAEAGDVPTAPASDEIRSDVRPAGITWESRENRDPQDPPPTPPPHEPDGGGGAQRTDDQEAPAPHPQRDQQAETTSRQIAPIPDTESAQLLQTINVKPAQIIELAQMETAIVEAAIADGRARDGIRDLAGWVVHLLRAHRDYGWKITPPAPRPDSPEALAAAFARYAAEQDAARRMALGDIEPRLTEPPPPEPTDSAREITKLWNNVLAAMRLQVERHAFNTWIRRAILLSIADGIATISAPSAFVKEGLEHRYATPLRELIGMLAGFPVQLRIIIGALHREVAPAGAAPAALDRTTDPSSHAGVTPPAVPPPDPDHRPDWISAVRWGALPAMLRAALIGSILVDGKVRAVSPHLGWLLRTRYGREVAELVAEVGSREHHSEECGCEASAHAGERA
jgi:hypothetical protein